MTPSTMHTRPPLKTIRITNGKGMCLELLNFGARIRSLHLPVGNSSRNIVVGYSSLEDYLADRQFMGGIIGRYSNRIAQARFRLNGQEYYLSANEGVHHLHGGYDGFHRRFWDLHSSSAHKAIYRYVANDGEEGYPGTLRVQVCFNLTDDNSLEIEFQATSDSDTCVSLTNHSYFNLQGSDNLSTHQFMFNSDYVLPVDGDKLPCAPFQPVDNSPFDFRDPRFLGDMIMDISNGYDHYFMRKSAVQAQVECDGIVMVVESDLPGFQFYTGQYLQAPFQPFSAFCIEPQMPPDGPNDPGFLWLKAGELYHKKIKYHFQIV